MRFFNYYAALFRTPHKHQAGNKNLERFDHGRAQNQGSRFPVLCNSSDEARSSTAAFLLYTDSRLDLHPDTCRLSRHPLAHIQLPATKLK